MRMYLRELAVGDITPAYVNGLNDPEVVQYTGARHVRWDRQSVEEYVKRSNIEGESQLLGIFLRGSNQHIGNIRLSNFSVPHLRCELGIMIFDNSQWGKGYGTDALNAAADYIFGTLKLHRVCADYYSVNTASARIFAKAGFQIEGIFKDHFLLDGQYVDSVRIGRINPAL